MITYIKSTYSADDNTINTVITCKCTYNTTTEKFDWTIKAHLQTVKSASDLKEEGFEPKVITTATTLQQAVMGGNIPLANVPLKVSLNADDDNFYKGYNDNGARKMAWTGQDSRSNTYSQTANATQNFGVAMVTKLSTAIISNDKLVTSIPSFDPILSLKKSPVIVTP